MTVHLRCADDLPPRRYVIVQLPTAETLNFCELQVFVRRTYLYTVISYGVPVSLGHDSVTLISTLLLTYLLTYLPDYVKMFPVG